MATPPRLLICNGKGGVGKTTTAANIGGLAAANGYRVLIIELDPQCNQQEELGFTSEYPDNAFVNALLTRQNPPIVAGVRPNLDVIEAGDELDDIVGIKLAKGMRGRGGTPSIGEDLEALIAPIASNYDLIIYDTPPRELALTTAAMETADYVLILTKTDKASIKGLNSVANLFAAARSTKNPSLRLLGVLLFAIGGQSRRIDRLTREKIEQLIPNEVVAPIATTLLDTRIRHLETAAFEARENGLLIHELEGKAEADAAARFKALKSKQSTAGLSGIRPGSAQGLAEDWEHATYEVLQRISTLQSAEAVTA